MVHVSGGRGFVVSERGRGKLSTGLSQSGDKAVEQSGGAVTGSFTGASCKENVQDRGERGADDATDEPLTICS